MFNQIYRYLSSILILMMVLGLFACSQTEETPESPTNTSPIYTTHLSAAMDAKDYDEKYEEGINKAIEYFGSYTGVYVYIYDTTGLDATIQDFCEKSDAYTTNDYSSCYAYESSSGHIKSDLETAQSNSFMTWLSSNNGFYAIFFALGDLLGDGQHDDSAPYLAHLAVHEYAHVFQGSKLDVDDRPYNQIFNEGYAQMIGQYIGDLNEYVTFETIMLDAFRQFYEEHKKDRSQFLAAINDNFETITSDQRMPFMYAGASWCMAYLIHRNNASCTSNCTQGLNDLKSYYEQAQSTNHEAIFKQLFNYESYSEFYTEVIDFLNANDEDELNTAVAAMKTWIDTLESRLPQDTATLLEN